MGFLKVDQEDLLEFGRKLGLETIQDEALNIIIKKPASKGYENMADVSKQIGANTFQFFTRNPRGGSAKEIDEEDVKRFLEKSKEYGIDVILAHAPYTLNCASADESIRVFAKNTMKDDLRRMEYTPGNLYNFHPGSHVGQGIDVGIDFIIEALNEVLTKEQTTTVLLETMAGKGSEVGSRFEELRQIIDKVELKEKIGVCLDICHVSDAGYDIINDIEGVIKEFNEVRDFIASNNNLENVAIINIMLIRKERR